MIIYYKPGCSKCSEAIQILENNNCEFELRDYLSEPPDEKELAGLISKLGCRPLDIVRTNEKLFIEKFADASYSDEEWIRVLSEHPVLIERPIIIEGSRAIIGRPPVKVLDILEKN